MMTKCKIALSDGVKCGKTICCFECSERANCEYVCNFNVNEQDECSSKIISDEPAVFEKNNAVIISKIAEFETAKKAIEKQEKELKAALLKAMEDYGVKKFETPDIIFTYVAETTRTTIDSKKIKAKYPQIAEECSTVSPVAASVRVKVKE